MKESNGTYTASLPTDKTGDMFYYIEVKTDKETVTKPYTKSEPIVLNIDDGKANPIRSPLRRIPSRAACASAG